MTQKKTQSVSSATWTTIFPKRGLVPAIVILVEDLKPIRRCVHQEEIA